MSERRGKVKTVKKTPPVSVGDLVTTDYDPDSASVVRRVTRIGEDPSYGSGYWASADGGVPCQSCGRPFATPIHKIDAYWFTIWGG